MVGGFARPDVDCGEALIGRHRAAVAGPDQSAVLGDDLPLVEPRLAMRLAMRRGSSAEAKAIMEKFGSSTKAKRCGARAGSGAPLSLGC